MAKGKRPPNQLPGPGVRQIATAPLTANAKDLREKPYIYANHAVFGLNANEVFVDFYNLQPEPGNPSKTIALFVERVVIPVGLSKGFATGMANIVAVYEKAMDVVVPLSRTPDPDDVIKIWDET